MDREFSLDEEAEKYYADSLSTSLRDRMATAVCHIAAKYFEPLAREKYCNIEEHLRMIKIKDAFEKLKWDRDVFDAEYLIKRLKKIEHMRKW